MAKWLSTSRAATVSGGNTGEELKKKCPEIPRLSSYSENPDAAFWAMFPFFAPKPEVQSRVDVNELEKLVSECWHDWPARKRKIARRTIKILKEGALTKLQIPLPAMQCANAKSALQHGEMLTDTVAHWVKEKMVAGPFKRPPLEDFRVNAMMAVAQKNKIRPVMNLSTPAGASFNEAIRPETVRKLEMSSAKLFGQGIVRAGRSAKIAKYDIRDAYKLIAGHPAQWRYFGFKWLGRYFYDVTTVFGSGSAPANFDGLPETLANIVCTKEKIPESGLFRQLDDVPFVSAGDSGNTEKFAAAYTDICRGTKVPLAEMCPKREKAFETSTTGTVLGVKFDTEK